MSDETFGQRVEQAMKAFTLETKTLVVQYKKDNGPSGTLVITKLERENNLRARIAIRRIAREMGYSIIITEIKKSNSDHGTSEEI